MKHDISPSCDLEFCVVIHHRGPCLLYVGCDWVFWEVLQNIFYMLIHLVRCHNRVVHGVFFHLQLQYNYETGMYKWMIDRRIHNWYIDLVSWYKIIFSSTYLLSMLYLRVSICEHTKQLKTLK